MTTSNEGTIVTLDDVVSAICEACDTNFRQLRSITIRLAPQPASIDHLVDTPPIVLSVEFEKVT